MRVSVITRDCLTNMRVDSPNLWSRHVVLYWSVYRWNTGKLINVRFKLSALGNYYFMGNV